MRGRARAFGKAFRRVVHGDGAERAVFRQQSKLPKLAWQMRVAFSSIEPNTGCKSPGELEMTWSTSDVAVCCSSDSVRSSVRWRSSVNSRVFSMAMTAWAAKFVHQVDLLVGEWPNLLTVHADDADQFIFLEHRHDSSVRTPLPSMNATASASCAL